MPYVQRDGSSRVIATYANAQAGFATEFLPDTDPAVLSLLDPVPDPISDRQFFQQLAVQGIISQNDALAAVKTGTIPSVLQQLVDSLPADQQFGATMIIAGATSFQRHHPLTEAIGQAYGWSYDQVNAFWRSAAAL